MVSVMMSWFLVVFSDCPYSFTSEAVLNTLKSLPSPLVAGKPLTQIDIRDSIFPQRDSCAAIFDEEGEVEHVLHSPCEGVWVHKELEVPYPSLLATDPHSMLHDVLHVFCGGLFLVLQVIQLLGCRPCPLPSLLVQTFARTTGLPLLGRLQFQRSKS